jgi:hypothetical protein
LAANPILTCSTRKPQENLALDTAHGFKVSGSEFRGPSVVTNLGMELDEARLGFVQQLIPLQQ